MKGKHLGAPLSPFVFSGLRLEAASAVILLSLLAQAALIIAFSDTRALAAIFASLAGAAVAELCFSSPASGINGRCVKFSDGAAAISGLATGFLLPSAVSPFLAGVASFFGLFVSRNFFNGRGNAWISAPALAVIFVFISAPSYFEGLEIFPPAASLPHEAAAVALGHRIAAAINNAFLKPLGISLPEGYSLLFFNPAAPVPALKFNIVTLISSVLLFALGVIDWIAPAVSLAAYAAGIYFFSSSLWGGSFSSPLPYVSAGGNILFALFSGGVFFAAVYLLSDFPSLPRTRTGRVLLGVLAGGAALLACGPGGSSPAGAAFAVFAANLLSLAIGYAEDRILRVHFAENALHGEN